MECTIRALREEDVDGAMALVRRVFDQFEAPDYPEEGREEFVRYIEPAAIRARLRAGELCIWVAEDAGELAGVLALRPPAHLSLLFVDPAFHRRGIARQLLEAAVAHCAASGAEGPMTVHASPYGLEAYRRMGFAETGPKQTVNGLIFIPMARILEE